MDFTNRTCVVTGGARGIGFGLVGKALALGMNVVIADVDGLDEALAKLQSHADRVLCVNTE